MQDRAASCRRALVALACALTALIAAAPAQALDNGLARTPQMGFNNWNATHCGDDFNEEMVKATADFFVSSGLKEAGYEYVNLDDCWAAKERNADGDLEPNLERFPHGIKALADYVHSKGLKLGIYTSAGTETCARQMPGALDHEDQDAARFASWGIDYLKYDNCNNQGRDAVERYTKMRDALAATGRDILYSICEWGQNDPWLWAQDVGNSWRTTGDISDNWSSMVNIVHQNMVLADYAGPGHWNDPDMLEIGNGGMSDTEYRSHFSLWAIMAAPLLIGSDLRDATPETMDILENQDVIDVDQDPLGRQGRPIRNEDGHVVFAKEMADGSRAVALFNETDQPARIATSAAEVGLDHRPAYRIRDLWAHTDRETAGTIAATVPPHGTAMYRVAADHRWNAYPPLVDTGVDIARPYPGATAVVSPGQHAGVTTTATNYGRVPAHDVRAKLSAPDGWDVRATSPRSAHTLGSGRAFETAWTVAVPEGARPGSYTLTATIGYAGKEHHGHHGHGHHGGGRISTTRELEVVIPTPPPGGTTNLGDAEWLHATNGYGPVERNTSNGERDAGDGQTMSIEGTEYATGLGAHAPGEIEFYLGGDCSSLTTWVGVDDEKSASGTVTFELWVDGTKVADSGLMDTATPAKQLTADLSGATLLRLVATDGGDGNNSDHADWADPRLTCTLRPPPSGTSFLSDLTWQSASNGWGPVERDSSVGDEGAGDGRTLTIGDQTYDKGLGTHAPADIGYYLGGACSRLQADVGVDDETDSDKASVTFEVWADDAKVYDSGLLTAADPPQALDADLAGAQALRLVVTDYDGSKDSDHADWGGARITCGGDA